MTDNSREERLHSTLDVLNRGSGLIPKQARAVDFVSRTYTEAMLETPGEREVAAAAARTSVITEISSRWPGSPYVIWQGPVEDYPELSPEPSKDALFVFGVVYQAED